MFGIRTLFQLWPIYYTTKMMPMAKLSLCMIVKDEEKNLPGCLECIKEVVDEIIIVDTGSTDNTIKIAKDYGAKVYYFDWCDDFSAARNESLKYATGDYIIWLDADDRIEKEEIEKLIELKNRLPKDKNKAYALKITNFYKEETCYQIRIFPNLSKIRFEGRVHEQVSSVLSRLKIPTHLEDINILHLGYKNPYINRKKGERNLRLLLEELKANPNNWMTHYFLGQTYKFLGENEQAKLHFKNTLVPKCKRDNQFVYIAAGISFMETLLEEGRKKEAYETLFNLEREFPQNAVVKFFLAKLYINEDQYEKGLNTLLAVNPEKLDLLVIPIPHRLMNFEYYLNLARCYEKLGYLNLATGAYEMAYESAKKVAFINKEKILGKIANLFIKLKKYRDAIKYLKERLKINKNEISYTLLGIIYLLEKEKENAKQAFKSALMINPNYFQAKFHLAELYIEENNLLEAQALLESIIFLPDIDEKKKLDAYLMLAFVYAIRYEIERCVLMVNNVIKGLGLPYSGVVHSLADLIAIFIDIGKILQGKSMPVSQFAFKTASQLTKHLTFLRTFNADNRYKN